MKATLRPWGRALLDVLFPPQCVACRRLGREPFCPACEIGAHAAGAFEVDGVDEAHACWQYGGPVAQAIQRLKYDGAVDVARPLGAAMWSIVDPLTFDVAVPVPLTRRRLAARGFNQARELMRGWPRPMLLDAVKRVSEGPAQVGRGRAARRAGLAGAFVARPSVAGRRVLVVDDVVTTGATVQAMAAALRRAGARWVGVAAVAVVAEDPPIDQDRRPASDQVKGRA